MEVFVIDVARCVGCRNCQIACKDEHCGNDWTPYARPQPETGQFWCQVNENIRGTVPKVKIAYVTRLCMHCDAAPCIPACPVEGGIFKRADGLVIIDSRKCTGCMKCVNACPYGCIYYNEDLKIAQKCTGCTHLLDRGWPIKEPRCVDACATGAIKFGEESDFSDLISKAEVLNPEYKTKPRVYYLNLPKRFIAGTVYDPGEKDVITGASCTLTGEGDTISTNTDGFGDFWFEGLKIGKYSLKIEAAGFAAKNIDAISTEKDVNLGDIPM
jgi:tetrathionate reductase subunit B